MSGLKSNAVITKKISQTGDFFKIPVYDCHRAAGNYQP